MKYLLFVMTLACVTSLGAPLAFADDDDFEKIMIQRKKPVYRDAAPERSYQDDDPADTPPPKAKKAKKIN